MTTQHSQGLQDSEHNNLLNQLDEEISHVRKEIQRYKKRKLELENMSEKELLRQTEQKHISEKELQKNLESQIDELIRQIPFKDELRYDKLRKQNQVGKLCQYCGEIDGMSGYRCSCNDI